MSGRVFGRVDGARDMIRGQVEPFLFITRSGAEHRFCVFVDADRMNVTAQNVFLRTLEEPPTRTLFLLLSTQPETLLETTISRVIRSAPPRPDLLPLVVHPVCRETFGGRLTP